MKLALLIIIFGINTFDIHVSSQKIKCDSGWKRYGRICVKRLNDNNFYENATKSCAYFRANATLLSTNLWKKYELQLFLYDVKSLFFPYKNYFIVSSQFFI